MLPKWVPLGMLSERKKNNPHRDVCRVMTSSGNGGSVFKAADRKVASSSPSPFTVRSLSKSLKLQLLSRILSQL